MKLASELTSEYQHYQHSEDGNCANYARLINGKVEIEKSEIKTANCTLDNIGTKNTIIGQKQLVALWKQRII